MADGEKIRILIVDDIADTRDNLAKLIGFEPDMEVAGTADGGQAAVNMAKKERPHVILMDINMPDMDGITATDHDERPGRAGLSPPVDARRRTRIPRETVLRR